MLQCAHFFAGEHSKIFHITCAFEKHFAQKKYQAFEQRTN